jgi:hypothetical protein
VQNSAYQAGLGRTTGLQQAIASAQAQYLLPQVRDAIAREERGIDRQLGNYQTNIQRLADLGTQVGGAQERQINRAVGVAQQQGAQQQQARQFLAGLQQQQGQFGENLDFQRAVQAIGADERSRALALQQSQGAVDQLARLGASEQQFQQSYFDRATQDYLRRQALSERLLFQPFGLVSPRAIGQTSETSGGKKGK